MFKHTRAFSGFSVDDIKKAEHFYGKILGLSYSEGYRQLHLHLVTGANIFIYPKPDHRPASYTVLNFPVNDIMRAMSELKTHGIHFESYNEPSLKTDEHGLYRSTSTGACLAWFKDPAGNLLSLVQER